ncbi:sugar ABC transporter ATP-binding protein [Phyllobacterium sp. 0TCS1.6C]|uniref:sugar ABC transporter ATP-binding protein n=2 Tax=unclassified Phyllobacterium TaxID=2638441 RepID=UPI002264E23E|nr:MULTISPECIES: sugar ABC transporter ATP-binding protein [unclassified Phyllobacterium]MCX8279343.1 sugar ABC transporter ATP-binding protein [Phyllobacterium sp. 0TCS1.6C]MCX8292466.1 sugar ABC transporter ATP-binding protein [Phyllobacterium sp. 0TCS1.6A]
MLHISLKECFGRNILESSAPIVSLRGISKNFAHIMALESVDLDIHAGEIHAVMGENGAGKSTLVKILSGVYRRSGGTMTVRGEEVDFVSPKEAERYGIAIIHQELNLIPSLSVAENIFLGREPMKKGLFIDYRATETQSAELLSRFGIDIDPKADIENLRVGEQQLVEIARALSLNADVLILDEPTSALSEAEAQQLARLVRMLAERGVAIVYISHRMNEVFALADKITVLRDGRFIATHPASAIGERDVIRMMVGRELQPQRAKEPVTAKPVVLSAHHLGLSRPNSRGRVHAVVDDVSFDVHAGEILGIGGLLGSGRTEVLELIFGAAEGQRSGTIIRDGSSLDVQSLTPRQSVVNGIGFLTEDRKGTGLLLDADIRSNAVLPSLPWLAPTGLISKGRENAVARRMIKAMRVRCQGPDQKIDELSGGNQQKIVLGKWLETRPRVVLLDEPTRGIDVGAKEEIYELLNGLAASGVAIVMVSSELPELLALSHRIVVMCEGKATGIVASRDFSEERIMELATPRGSALVEAAA